LPGKSFRDRTKLKALYTRDPKDVGPGIMASPSEPVQKAKELASTTSNTSPGSEDQAGGWAYCFVDVR